MHPCDYERPQSPILQKDELVMQGLVKDYLCPLCNEILYHAVQSNCCRSTFCRYCFLKWIDMVGNTLCPSCDETNTSYTEVQGIDEYIDNEFASVGRELQEQRQVLIGSRYFPERRLCLQHADRQTQAKLHANTISTTEPEVQRFRASSRGRGDDVCNGSHILNKTEIQHAPNLGHTQIKNEITEIFKIAKNSSKPPVQRRHRPRSTRPPLIKPSIEDYSKVKAEIRDIVEKTERQTDLVNSQKLLKPKSSEHFRMQGLGTTVSNEKLIRNPNSNSNSKLRLESEMNLIDLRDSYERMRLSAQTESMAHVNDDLKRQQKGIAQEEELLTEVVKRHESILRIQVERFRNETEELIGQLKSASRDIGAGKPETIDPEPKGQEQQALGSATIETANGKVKKKTVNSRSSKKSGRRDRVPRSHRPHKRIVNSDHGNTRRSHSTTSSLEALNSESNLDLGSIEEDLRVRMPRGSQSHEGPRTPLTHVLDTTAPARARILGKETWYDRVVQAAITSTTEGMVQQNAQSTPSWFKNLQALNSSLQATQVTPDSKKPPKKKSESLDAGSWSKAITETARKVISEKINNPQFQSVDPRQPEKGNIAAENHIVFGNKMQPRRLPCSGEQSSPNPNLLFGNTSPYFSWKPGMLLSPDRLPIPPGVNKADRTSRRSKEPTAATPRVITRKDKEELLENVRRQMAEEEETRRARQARLDHTRKIMKEKKLNANASKSKIQKSKPSSKSGRTK